MTIEGLPQEEIERILKAPQVTTQTPTARAAPVNPQRGPLRFKDTPDRCKSKGCNSPTWLTVDYKRLCETHALRRLNEIVVELQDKQTPINDWMEGGE